MFTNRQIFWDKSVEIKCIESMLLILKLSFTKYVYNLSDQGSWKISTDRQTDRPRDRQTSLVIEAPRRSLKIEMKSFNVPITKLPAVILQNCARQNVDTRPRQDSNLQSPDPKSGALSIRPRGLIMDTRDKRWKRIIIFQSCLK